MDITQKVSSMIEAPLDALGYRLVLVKLGDQSRRKTLTIMAERKDGEHMGVEDCTEISRTAGALLEVEDPISSAYDLEVCSPGLDRPLTTLDDFDKYQGFDAKIETMVAVAEGRKRFRGMLQGVQGEKVKMKMPEGKVEIAFDNIRSAKLMMTDELVSSQLKQQKKKVKG
ncbi:MAG: ribosome maturation factor RimP [Rickettsiales bacterium]